MPEDVVNNPKHYQPKFYNPPLQCRDIARYLDFDLGCAFKYIWRAGDKDNIHQDLDKAKNYLKDFFDNEGTDFAAFKIARTVFNKLCEPSDGIEKLRYNILKKIIEDPFYYDGMFDDIDKLEEALIKRDSTKPKAAKEGEQMILVLLPEGLSTEGKEPVVIGGFNYVNELLSDDTIHIGNTENEEEFYIPIRKGVITFKGNEYDFYEIQVGAAVQYTPTIALPELTPEMFDDYAEKIREQREQEAYDYCKATSASNCADCPYCFNRTACLKIFNSVWPGGPSEC